MSTTSIAYLEPSMELILITASVALNLNFGVLEEEELVDELELLIDDKLVDELELVIATEELVDKD